MKTGKFKGLQGLRVPGSMNRKGICVEQQIWRKTTHEEFSEMVSTKNAGSLSQSRLFLC
jgi:hypothetical protein